MASIGSGATGRHWRYLSCPTAAPPTSRPRWRRWRTASWSVTWFSQGSMVCGRRERHGNALSTDAGARPDGARQGRMPPRALQRWAQSQRPVRRRGAQRSRPAGAAASGAAAAVPPPRARQAGQRNPGSGATGPGLRCWQAVPEAAESERRNQRWSEPSRRSPERRPRPVRGRRAARGHLRQGQRRGGAGRRRCGRGRRPGVAGVPDMADARLCISCGAAACTVDSWVSSSAPGFTGGAGGAGSADAVPLSTAL